MSRTLEKDERFSMSRLWQLQESAYQQFGIGAWEKEGVPFYLTSNPYSVNIAVELALAYLEDNRARLNPDEPFFLFDLGAGCGRFAFLFLTMFLPRASMLFPRQSFRYVMTDIVEETFTFWQQHPHFQQWYRNGILDCAYYRHDQKEPMLLLCSEEKVTTLENPCLLLANYFFDTIPQDLFRIDNHTIEEGRVTLTHDASGIDDDDPRILKHLQCHYRFQPVAEDYYSLPISNRLLAWYRDHFDGFTFLFPSGAFQVLDTFATLAPCGYFLYATDQGVVTDAQLRSWGLPRIDHHGTFSIGVSYHALAQAFRLDGDVALTSDDPDPLFVLMAAVRGGGPQPHLTQRFASSANVFEPKDYWLLGESFLNQSPSLQELITFLKLGRADPVNIYTFYPQIEQALATASAKDKQALVGLLRQAANTLFPICPAEEAFIHQLRAAVN